MKYITTIFLIILATKGAIGQRARSERDFQGAWMNAYYYDLLMRGDPQDSLQYISPRLLFIDPAGGYRFEERFETPGKITLHPRPVIGAGGELRLELKYASLRLLNDSLIEYHSLSPERKMVYRKLSNAYDCVPCGMQIFFRNLFWGGAKDWELTEYNPADGSPHADKIKIDAMRFIRPDGRSWHYEFLDTEREKIGGEKLFMIDFFDVDANNMSVNNRTYAIRKQGSGILLLDHDKLKYSLRPL